MPLDYAIDPSLEDAAKPRYKGDSIAADYSSDILRSRAAMGALRNDPKNMALNQDAQVPVVFTNQYMGEGVRGNYNLDDKVISVKARMSEEQLRRTALHELLHSLHYAGTKGIGEPNQPASDSPGSVLDLGRGWQEPSLDKQALPGYEGSPRDFAKAIGKAGMYYGGNEPAAWFGGSLNQDVKMDPQVREVAAQFPGLAGMFAAQNAQPNRPAVAHYKGYPEMTTMEKLGNNVLGMQYPIDPQARYAVMQAQVLRKLNEQTNPRDRH